MSFLPTVFLVDPDPDFRRFCQELCQAQGVVFSAVSHPRDLLETVSPPPVGCILSEWRGEGWSGLQLHRWLAEAGWQLPLVIAACNASIHECAQAFRAGVADFVVKPLSVEEFEACLSRNLESSRTRHQAMMERLQLHQRLAKLTEREEAVARALVAGCSMKEIASNFGTSFQSVARHRQRILAKLEVENDVALANLWRECLVEPVLLGQSLTECSPSCTIES